MSLCLWVGREGIEDTLKQNMHSYAKFNERNNELNEIYFPFYRFEFKYFLLRGRNGATGVRTCLARSAQFSVLSTIPHGLSLSPPCRIQDNKLSGGFFYCFFFFAFVFVFCFWFFWFFVVVFYFQSDHLIQARRSDVRCVRWWMFLFKRSNKLKRK